jgi:5-aminopentanamidase
MSRILRIAGVQMDVRFADKPSNVAASIKRLQSAVELGAELVVFPECALTGYCFESLDEAMTVAEPIDGDMTQAMVAACQKANVHAVFGLLERDGTRLFNALALVGPTGLIGSYRKIHLPHLGVDLFATPGDRPFAVHSIDIGAGEKLRLGMNICYDGSFPESARCLALQGADLIVLPTNWPPGAGCTADVVPNARAMENYVYFASVNRVGEERGFHFIGKSKVADPDGRDLVFANHDHEEIFVADIDFHRPRNKHLVRVPGKHEIDRFKDRRPDMYQPVVNPIE